MTVKNLHIENFEPKKTKTNKVYTRFQTNEGWMSCFNDKVSEELIKKIGQTVSVDTTTAGDFQNIVGLGGNDPVSEDLAEVEVEQPKITKQVKADPSISRGRDTSFYTAYAKDIFIALLEKSKMVTNLDIIMAEAIGLVKQAQFAF